jgi:hypothetical protein
MRTYYLLVTGKRKDKKVLSYFVNRTAAINVLNELVLDYGMDARLETTKIEPSQEIHGHSAATIATMKFNTEK